MSAFYAIAAAVVVAGAYSAHAQSKAAKAANEQNKRNAELQAQANAASAKINQEQQNKPVAEIADSREIATMTKVRQRNSNVVRGLGL